MVFKNELYPIHFYGRVRGKCDGRLQNWPGIANERPKFLAMVSCACLHCTLYGVAYVKPGQVCDSVYAVRRRFKLSQRFTCLRHVCSLKGGDAT